MFTYLLCSAASVIRLSVVHGSRRMLFEPKRFNWVEMGGLARWVIAEKDTDGGREHKAADDPHNTARHAQNHRLSKELQEHV